MVNCCIYGCKSRSERNQPNITFHRFPNEPFLRNKWTECTGRVNWHPSRHSRICSRHFEASCIRHKLYSTHLNPRSIPTLFIQVRPPLDQPSSSKCDTLEVDMEAKDYLLDDSSMTDSHGQLSLPSEEVAMEIEIESTMMQRPIEKSSACVLNDTMTPRKKKLVKKLNRQTFLAETRKKKLAVLRSKCRRIEKNNAELSEIIEKLKFKNLINQETADILSSINPQQTDFLHAKKSKYSPHVRKFALHLHFISPRAYNFVRSSFNTCLPHTRTLARWYQTVDAEPGFSKESLEALKLLTINSKRTWVCALSFDEMAIRKCVQWDGKNMIGLVNCGHEMDNDELPVAKEALVYMVTCINGSWKLPLGYFLIDGVSAEQKASLLKTCLDLVNECGVNVATVTFDGCPAKFSMAKLLGCNIEDDLINTVFTHNGKKIAIFPDPSHMLKLVRNTLGDKTFLSNDKGDIVSWNYIKLLVELQEQEGFHLANKVRSAHIHYEKQVMKVRLASLLFSESVADAIESCSEDLRLEQFCKSEATVDFIRKFNRLFDIMNSRNLNSYGFKKPLSMNHFESVKDFLETMYNYIKALNLGSVNILKTNRKTGFLEFLMCIKSILFLYEKLIKQKKIDFLSTYKLRQDHLEIFFSAIRAKGGFNNNPTAMQFKSAFKRLLVHGELKHLVTGNCVPLTDINILMYSRPEVAINKTTDRNRLIEDDDEILQSLDNEIVVSKDHDYLTDPTRLTEFAKQVIIYIAGFVVNKLEAQIKCEECLSCLRSSEKIKNTFLHRKDKGGLSHPSKHIIKLCEIAEEVYRKNKTLNVKNPMHYLLQDCLKKCIGLRLFSENYHFCDLTHYSLLIKAVFKKYLNTRIHYATKSIVDKKDMIRSMYTKLILFKGQ